MKTKTVCFFSKVLVLAMVLCVAATMLVIPSKAAAVNAPMPLSNLEIIQTYNGSFDEAWEKTYTGSVWGTYGESVLTIIYGFNTFLIDEDYCWAYADEVHWAELHNGNGHHVGLGATAGKRSRVDVTHSGDEVTYYCCLVG